jgi:hypothetical protein
MAKVIYPADLWSIQRLPEVPYVAIAPHDFSEEQRHDFDLAFGILHLLNKPNGERRTVRGVNRAAQNRWPDEPIISQWFVGDILQAWAMAGRRGVVDVIAGGKMFMPGYGEIYYRIHHELKSLAIRLSDNVRDGEAAFPVPSYLARCMDQEDEGWRFFRVAAQTNYGTYKFVAISDQVPDWDDISAYCLWHTLHPPRNIHFS